MPSASLLLFSAHLTSLLLPPAPHNQVFFLTACAPRYAFRSRTPSPVHSIAPPPPVPASASRSRQPRARCRRNSAPNVNHPCPGRRIFRHPLPEPVSPAPSLHRVHPRRFGAAPCGSRCPFPSGARSRTLSRPYRWPDRRLAAAALSSSHRTRPHSHSHQTTPAASGARSAQTLPRRACLSGIHADLHFQQESCGLTPFMDENGCKIAPRNAPSYRHSCFLQARELEIRYRTSHKFEPTPHSSLLLLWPGPQSAPQVHQLP